MANGNIWNPHTRMYEAIDGRMADNLLISGVSGSCSVCKSKNNVRFVQITDCNLCEKCDNDLSESFELAGKMDRRDYPEL